VDIDLTHVAAFLSGMGAVISAVVSLRVARRRAEKDCRERIDEVREAIAEGFKLGRE